MSGWSRAFERVEHGQTPAEAPADLQTWTRQTACGLLGGLFFGGYRGLLKSRTSEPSPIPANSMVHRTTMFVVREGIFTGARIGIFVSMFSALALAAHNIRGREHPANFAAAGGITCALFGGAVAGWRGTLPGVAFGSAISGAAAYVQDSLKDAAAVDEYDRAVKTRAVQKEVEEEERVRETIDRLIDRFETSVEGQRERDKADGLAPTVSENIDERSTNESLKT